MQVVSGTGAKHLKAKKAKHSLFANNKPGYVVVDIFAKQQCSTEFLYWVRQFNRLNHSPTSNLISRSSDEVAIVDTACCADSVYGTGSSCVRQTRKIPPLFVW